MRRVAWALIGASAISALAFACKGGMAKIEAVRDALEKDDAAAIKSAIDGYPACPDAPPVALSPKQPSPRDTGCLADIANALGSKKGFAPSPPDQAAATTAAIVILRDGRGDYLAHSEAWIGSLKAGKGTGVDALRLAVAHKMAEAAPKVGRRIDDEKDARAALAAVAGAIPGACPTYWLLGSGAEAAKIPAELSAEHATCVHRDLARREGPGASYGDGTFRALEGSLALWRETERALRLGLTQASPSTKAAVEAKLKAIEGATQAIATKKMASAQTSEALTFMGEVHADAGIMLWKDAGAKDAAAEGGADAGK
ncbi:MAG: hypothetical protein KF819_36790 [Labilithrix sp.]|nr:hypothetical protein [Labilithrix sp.]